jgi:hypothetical protein
MPITATTHATRVRQLDVTFPEYDHSTDPDKTLTIWYYPEAYAAVQEQITDAIADASTEVEAIDADDSLSPAERRQSTREIIRRSSDLLFSLFGDVLVDWDFYEDAEQTRKMPISAETFTRFRATVARINEAIGEEGNRPNPRPSRGSNGRSSRR